MNRTTLAHRLLFPAAVFAALTGLTTAVAQDTPFASDRAPAGLTPASAGASAAAPTEADVQRLIDKALKDRDEKAKAAEAEKKKAEGESKSWDVGADRKMNGSFVNGLVFESADKSFRMTVGGVNQFDMGWYRVANSQVRSVGRFNNLVDPDQSLQDGMDFRRARLRMSGVAYEQLEFFAQYEFANAIDLRQRTLGIPNPAGEANPVTGNFDPNEGPLFNEVYIGLLKLPVIGNVRVGRHRESLNFVTATADNNQLWMERGLMFDPFNGNYNFSQGVTVSRTYFNDRAYTLFGLFMQNSSSGRSFSSVGDGGYVYDGRITCLPIYDEDNQHWVHVGVDYSYRNLYQDTVRYRARPDVRIGTSFQVPSVVDTGNIFSLNGQEIANLEFATAWGRWTFAAEGTASRVRNAYTGGLPRENGTLPTGVRSRGDYMAAGGYVELLWFLTPDHHTYVKDRPGYARVTPTRRFFLLEGDDGQWAFDCGAWEIGARYDYVDLTHGGINGGTAQGATACLNWYLTSNARVQINYSRLHRDFSPVDTAGRVAGDINALGVRFNCDF